jgi:hypothetical protein
MTKSSEAADGLPFLLISLFCLTSGMSLAMWLVTMILLGGLLNLNKSKDPTRDLAVLVGIGLLAAMWA